MSRRAFRTRRFIARMKRTHDRILREFPIASVAERLTSMGLRFDGEGPWAWLPHTQAEADNIARYLDAKNLARRHRTWNRSRKSARQTRTATRAASRRWASLTPWQQAAGMASQMVLGLARVMQAVGLLGVGRGRRTG